MNNYSTYMYSFYSLIDLTELSKRYRFDLVIFIQPVKQIIPT